MTFLIISNVVFSVRRTHNAHDLVMVKKDMDMLNNVTSIQVATLKAEVISCLLLLTYQHAHVFHKVSLSFFRKNVVLWYLWFAVTYSIIRRFNWYDSKLLPNHDEFINSCPKIDVSLGHNNRSSCPDQCAFSHSFLANTPSK